MRARSRAERRKRLYRLRRLLERRREIAERSWLREITPAEAEVRDVEDDAVEDLRHAVESSLAQLGSETLRGIDEAMRRLESGVYGVCADCGLHIPEARLQAIPFASRCRPCQAEREAARRAGPERGPAVLLGVA